MYTKYGHLSYCTNIHAGETWESHFKALKKFLPSIKEQVAPDQKMGIGLRLSNEASCALIRPNELAAFKNWLHEQQLYVFTMNGFPYGAFHQTKVKDLVHKPDWTTQSRLDYTVRLFHILCELLPEGLAGGISTSPLSYRYWHKQFLGEKERTRYQATLKVIEVVKHLMQIKVEKGVYLHLDIEPEPDGLLESGEEFLAWYINDLIPIGVPILCDAFKLTKAAAEEAIKLHVCLCYDICHFALGYEEHEEIIKRIKAYHIRIGKIQVSAALKVKMPSDWSTRLELKEIFNDFNEETYLHQVIAKTKTGALIRYRDLPEALLDLENTAVLEWRAHYHVPLFIARYRHLASTQEDVKRILKLQREEALCQHLEIETYTWDVLPPSLKEPIVKSIVREINWVTDQILK